MDDLAAFLRARLDEDEAAAKAARDQRDEDKTRWWFDDATPETPVEFHVARHDPARVLREAEAKRAILADYEEAAQHPYDLPEGVREGRDDDERERDQYLIDVLGDVVGHLAAIYDGHPDYRDEWHQCPR